MRINKGGVIMHDLQNASNISATIKQVVNGKNILESLHKNRKRGKHICLVIQLPTYSKTIKQALKIKIT